MGSDESHFNVSVGNDGKSHRTVSTNLNLFEEKGEPKRYRTEVLPLTNLTARPNRLTIIKVAFLLTLYMFGSFSPSLISLMVSVDVKRHVYLLTYLLL